MPHDVMLAEFSSPLSTDEIFPQSQPKGPSLLSAMKAAGRSLVASAKRAGGKGILSTMILAGVALGTPHAAKAECVGGTVTAYGYECLEWAGPGGTVVYTDPDSEAQGSSSNTSGGTSAGDPVNVATGNVFLHVTDYTTPGQNPLEFTRYYNSQATQNQGLTTYAIGFGFLSTSAANWRSNYDRYLQISPSSSPTSVVVERPDGQQITFTLSGSTWTPPTDQDYTLTHSGSTWTLKDHNDTVEVYNDLGTGKGQLHTITKRNGYQQTMSYSGSLLTSVTDSYSRTLSLSYTSGLLTTLTTPDSLVVSYGYTYEVFTGGFSVYQLTSVSYNTSPTTSQTYNYASSSQPLALTSVVDENGNTSASWAYDAKCRAISSQQGSGTLDANLTSFTYNSDGTTTVTNAYGVADTYTFSLLQGVSKLTGISRASTSTTAAATESFSYDTSGFLGGKTDWNGNVTNYSNDSHGDPQGSSAIVEAYGSSVARTTGITYDSTCVHLPYQITTPGMTSTFTYDGSCNVHTRTDEDTTTGSTPYSTNGTTREWTNTWGTGANVGLLTSVTGPRTDLTQTVGFGYPSSGSNTGVLTSITDPLSHVTTVNTYTGGGLPTKITDPNGVVTNIAYDARLNLHTSELVTGAGNLTTTYAHDAANNVTQVTLPDSSYLAYTYDTANRLTKVTNALGEYISLTLDYLGDPTASNIYNASSTMTRKHTATFDALGRELTDVAWTTTSASNTTTYAYDANSNVTSIEDPRGHTTGLSPDALNRLHQVTDRLSHTTTASYDAHDAVISVVDPNGNTTTYTRDGFERAIQLVSPDSGTSVYHFDLAGNLTQKTDGASKVTNRTFDAANRELTRTFPGNSAEDVTNTYDQTGSAFGFGIGRLTTMADAAQTLYVGYDERGNDIEEAHTITGYGGYTFYVNKYYDNASRIYAILNPSGWFMGWNRDAAGQVNNIGIQPYGSSTVTNIVGNGSTTFITHEPFGPAISLPFQNGITRTNTYDLDYRLTNQTDTGSSTVLNLSYGYDANNNVTGITDSLNAANGQTMAYTNMDRLYTAASGTGGYGSYQWAWDANGNRTSETLNGGTADTYSYTSGTNKLSSTSGSGFGVSYNGAGAITAVSQYSSPLSTEAWTQSEQSASVTFAGSGSPAASYSYDGFGQRFLKTAAVGTAYLYGALGNLTEENNSVGQITDYISLDPSSPRDAFYPVGMIGIPGIGSDAYDAYYVHADRLGTPQKVTGPGSSQTVQWSTTYAPFGATAAAITNPNGITQNLRLPGMYSDPETGLYHNGFREYVPILGMYFQTDPIGIAGGTATYTYANGNAFRFRDRSGLDPNSSGGGGGGSGPQTPGNQNSSGGGSGSNGPCGGFASAGAAVTGAGGSCSSGSGPLPPTGQNPSDGGGYNGTLTIGYTAIDGNVGGSKDWGIGADTAGHICLIEDVCIADPTGTLGMLWGGGPGLGASQGTFGTGSSTTQSTQVSADGGFIGAAGMSFPVDPKTGEFTGISRGFGGVGGGGGVGTWTCTTKAFCKLIF